MYVSKYYTCEEIDQRLLQGYYDDFVKAGFVGTLNEFWAFVLSIKDMVVKKEGYDLSQNDFTDELKAKLDGIEEHANYVTKLSQLENDLSFQTAEDVQKLINELVDGATDSLDTLKELAEALGNDPNFATTITNKLTDLRTALTEEIGRAKEAETGLGSAITKVTEEFELAISLLTQKVDSVKSDIEADITRVEGKADKNAADIQELKDKLLTDEGTLEKEFQDLVNQEKAERIAGDEALQNGIQELKQLHITDKASLEAEIAAEASTRTNADTALESKINEEVTNRQADTQALQSKLDQEVVDRKSEDKTLSNAINTEVANRTNADDALQVKIDEEAQARTTSDTVLQTNIDEEAVEREAQDTILQHEIDDLKEQSKTDKESMQGDLAKEIQDRKDADTALDNKKIDKREGYDLSKNDFTDLLKAKLDEIEEHANYITRLSELINDADFQTSADVTEAINKVIGAAPEVLDTLAEIAEALGDDPNFATTITKKLAAITEQLNQEIEDRKSGDTANSTEVTNEATARDEADKALEAKLREYIDGLATDSDTALDVVKDNLAKEIQDRKDADAILQGNIDKEIADRKGADAVHDQDIKNLNKRISELSVTLQEAINTLRNELTEQVNANSTAIVTAQQEIEQNAKDITELTKKVADNYQELKDMVNEEIVDRTNADSSLSSRIDNLNIDLNTEKVERKAADDVLQVNLDKEIADRTNADTALSTEFTAKLENAEQALDAKIDKLDVKIGQEVTDRTASEKVINSRIDALETTTGESLDALKAQVKENTTAVAAEKDRAMAKEELLSNQITTNYQNHKDDMASLNASLAKEKSDRMAADKNLQTNINEEATNRANNDLLIKNSLAQEKADRIAGDQNLDDKKVDKESGKGLSQNDFTDLLLDKLNNIEDHANYVTKTSQLENDSDFQNADQVNALIQAVIGAAPTVLDTLEEIAKALGDDPNFAATITTKIDDLRKLLEQEIKDRTAGDTTLNEAYNNFVTQLNSTITDIKKYVGDTRTEVLSSLEAANSLITQNAANIQRNLELIQGLQNTVNTHNSALSDLLDAENAARQAEDARLESKIDKNTGDLHTETEERQAADNLLQNHIDEEQAAREAEDKKLNERIDQEIQDRKDADTNLDNKFQALIDDHEERLQAEEATSDALPKSVVVEMSPIVITDHDVSWGVETAQKDGSNCYLSPKTDAKIIPAATQEAAGVQSAADKLKLDGLDPNAIVDLAVDSDAEKITVTVTKDNGIDENTTSTFDLPVVSQEHAGTMTAKDKTELDRIETANFALGEVTPTAETVEIDATKTRIEDNLSIPNPITIPAATQETAGAMIASDKLKEDRILTANFKLEDPTTTEDEVILHTNKTNADTNEEVPEQFTLPAATHEHAGVMTSTDKTNLDNTVAGLAKEIQDRKDALDAETKRAEAAEEKLTEDLNTESQRAKDAETTLQNNLNTENQRATDAETTLQNNLDTEQSRAEAAEQKLTDDLASEVERAKEAEANLTQQGKDDLAAAKKYTDDKISDLVNGADTALDTLKELADALGDDPNFATTVTEKIGEVQKNLDTESERAKAAEKKLTDDLATEVQRAKDAESKLTTDLNSEVTRAKAAETTLQSNIDTETKRAKDAEAALDARLKAAEGSASALPSSIVTNVSGVTATESKVSFTVDTSVKSTENNQYGKATSAVKDIPAATSKAAGVMTATDKTNLDNTVAGLAKEITDRTNAVNSLRTELKSYIDTAISEKGTDITNLEKKVDDHIANKSNPHGVTKAQVGLGNVDNTSDADKPVSTKQAAAIADAKAAGTAAQTAADNHAARRDNPHVVTRAQLKLDVTDQVVFAKTTAPSGFWKESSDERLKSNIKPLNHTLEQICEIPTMSFTMQGKDDEGTIAQGLEKAGFQNYVEEVAVAPSAVDNADEFEHRVINGVDYILVKQVKYHKMSTLAIEGIKLLKDEIEALKAEIQELKNR